MKFALDTEFIDTPAYSELISLALVGGDGRALYVEFKYPTEAITPWLEKHVVSQLSGESVSFPTAAAMIREFVGGSAYEPPEFWAYYGTYDWYWFRRVFGGMMELPDYYPRLSQEFALIQEGIPNLYGAEHHALNDARSLMHAMRLKNIT